MENAKRCIEDIKTQIDCLVEMVINNATCSELLNHSFSIQIELKKLDHLVVEQHIRKNVAPKFKLNEGFTEEYLRLFSRERIR